MVIGAANKAVASADDLRGLSWGQVGGAIPGSGRLRGRLLLNMLYGRAGLRVAGWVGAILYASNSES
jgi:hypothetical protein